jgi:hypothetical protein
MNIWKARITWENAEIDISPKWHLALSAWVLPSLFGELFIRALGGYFVGVIAGVSVSLLKSYYDFYRIMGSYYPHFRRRKSLFRILVPRHF